MGNLLIKRSSEVAARDTIASLPKVGSWAPYAGRRSIILVGFTQTLEP